jgi:GGDEF domain-containing protein
MVKDHLPWMKNLDGPTLPRPLINFTVAAGLIVASVLLVRQTGSATSALGIAVAMVALAGVVEAVRYLVGRRESKVVQSLGRVSEYRQRVSIYDHDSGLYADWYLGLRLHEEVARSRRYGQPLSLLLIEDSEGYLGETVKRLLFQALNACVRNTDIVAHLTDKRFAVMLTETDRGGAAVVAERMRESLPLRTIEVGMASFPEDGRDAASLLSAAGASAQLIDAITRGSRGTRTSIQQSDWIRPTDGPSAVMTDDVEQAEVEPALVEVTPTATLQPPELAAPPNVIDFPRAGRMCSVPDCGQTHHARGLCARHYISQRRSRVA